MNLSRLHRKRSTYTPLDERMMWHYVASQYSIGDRGFGPAFWGQFLRNHPMSKTASSLESHFRKKMVPRVHEASIEAEDVFKLMRHFKVLLDERAQQWLKRRFELDRIDVGRRGEFLWAYKKWPTGELTQYPSGYHEYQEDRESDSSSTSDTEDTSPAKRRRSNRHSRTPLASRTPSPRRRSQRRAEGENPHAQERRTRAVKISPRSSPTEFEATEFSRDFVNESRPGCSGWINSRKKTRSPQKALFANDRTLPLQPVMKQVKTSPSLKPHIGGLRSHPTRKRSDLNFVDGDRLRLLRTAKGQLSLDNLPDAINANKSWEGALRCLLDGASMPHDSSSDAVFAEYFEAAATDSDGDLLECLQQGAIPDGTAERGIETVDTVMATTCESDAAVGSSKEP